MSRSIKELFGMLRYIFLQSPAAAVHGILLVDFEIKILFLVAVGLFV